MLAEPSGAGKSFPPGELDSAARSNQASPFKGVKPSSRETEAPKHRRRVASNLPSRKEYFSSMNISNLQPITAQKTGNSWKLTVKYTATFSPDEVNPFPQGHNYTFRDAIQIWEWDVSDHDQITGWISAPSFNPSATAVQRTLVAIVNGDELDTELGGEEVRARIRLRNVTTSGVPIYKYTPIILLAP